MIIIESENFIVESHEKPFVSRADGGHIRIKVKDLSIEDRTFLSPKQAIELMRLTMIIGESFIRAMNNRGVPVVKINYQDMGNWAFKTGDKPFLHVHVFGRATDATRQIFPESVCLPSRESGFYEGFEPLNVDDMGEIRNQIEITLKNKKYNEEIWGLI
ncbi:MAG: hypothetical protein ACD_3C00054G0016 [uncultured bacterium (gcode 4)]|uniref:HIT domain-containing protein n=1 Tax=uncultured bacterium (gcode 4) TaxID=1234023 RepID=K2FBG8_9BACT|nr:MAG: hypothetical protein ACD_3C00054G0016 [uncultured bacterium (gcode 4)]